MYTEERVTLQRVVDNFIRTGNASDEQVKVINLPKGKTSHVEQIGVDGQSIMLSEYRVDDTVVYAGYSLRSKTVYLSLS